MVRGKTLFICPHCGKIFKAIDIEDGATVKTVPMPCPKCGTESPALNVMDLGNYLLRKLIKKS